MRDRLIVGGVVLLAVALAAFSARGTTAGWNDRSRLAAVESLVERGTLRIDDSFFAGPDGARSVFGPDGKLLKHLGTGDKIFVNGHYYSDKPPVATFVMAGVALVLKWVAGITAAGNTTTFVYLMTLTSSGVAYVAAVWCVLRLAQARGLPTLWAAGLAVSLAVGTVAPAYARNVNANVVLLAAVAGIALVMARLHPRPGDVEGDHDHTPRAARSSRSFVLLGVLTSVAYVYELATGPLLAMTMVGYLAYRYRKLGPLAACAAGALPLVLAHHAINYSVGGTIGPANAVPAYFEFPGSTFDETNITGRWNHAGFGAFLLYAVKLLVGSKGIVTFNPTMLLALVGLPLLLMCRRRTLATAEVVFLTLWAVMTWLCYAVLSTNFGGWSASIRWFVPFLAPAYFILAELLREYPASRYDLAALTFGGVALARMAWNRGPFIRPSERTTMILAVAAVAIWAAVRLGLYLRSRATGRGLGKSPVNSTAVEPSAATA